MQLVLNQEFFSYHNRGVKYKISLQKSKQRIFHQTAERVGNPLYRYIFPKLFHPCTTDSYAWLCFHNGMLNFKSVGVHFVIGIHTGNIFSLCLAYTQVQRTDKIMTILNHDNTFIIIRTDNITSIVCGTIIYYNAFEVFK